jgi:hypothetical protein
LQILPSSHNGEDGDPGEWEDRPQAAAGVSGVAGSSMIGF